MRFPTRLHARIADLAAGFFSHRKSVDTVLLVNSCARGVATPESDLDMAVLAAAGTSTADIQQLETEWDRFASRSATVQEFLEMGPSSRIHIDVFDGAFSPATWDEGGGPDTFEIEIGNRVAHPVPMTDAGPGFQALRSQWLPYYGDELWQARVEMVYSACRHDLELIQRYHTRGLPFQAFDRLYKAFQEFLQGLFISRRTYPVAYNKWIHEQVVEWLELPDLYEDLPKVLSVDDLEGDSVLDKSRLLLELADTWVRPEIRDAQLS